MSSAFSEPPCGNVDHGLDLLLGHGFVAARVDHPLDLLELVLAQVELVDEGLADLVDVADGHGGEVQLVNGATGNKLGI